MSNARRRAQNIVEPIVPNEIKNVFISHVHEDDDGLRKVKGLLEKSGMTIRDASINSTTPNNAQSPDYIKSEILAPGINWASTLLVYITPKTRDSEWVNWEIEYAEKQGKRIVGIWGHGDKGCDAPSALVDYADAVVGWNSDKIIDAINGAVNGWDTPEGKPCEPRKINRYSCG